MPAAVDLIQRSWPAAWMRADRVTALYVLLLMSLVSILGAYDRYLVGILVQSIKRDLHVSDGQIGLLTGIGFAVVYALLAVPLARLSDRGRRIPVLATSMLLWSGMTALCGFAGSFPLLLAARFGVGVGEAGCIPSTQAILSDRFSARWRTTAIAIVTVASGIGLTVASVAGGWISDRWGWRTAFVVGSLPGPLLAVLLWTTVTEPEARRRRAVLSRPRIGFQTAISTLLRVRSLRLLYIGYSLSTMASYGTVAWVPAYLMRRFGLTASQVGVSYGSVMGVSTIVALLAGGLLSEALARRNRRLPIGQMALSFALAFPFTLAFLFAGNLKLALLLAAPMTFFAMASSSIAYAEVQVLAGPRLRATGSALLLLAYNMTGVGLGPSLVGWFSDGLAGPFGSAALRDALALVSVTYLLGAFVMARAATSIEQDAASADARGAPPVT